MLNRHGGDVRSDSVQAGRADVWYDLCRPTDEEIAEVERAIGTRLPTRQQIASIEMSRRCRLDDGMLRLNVPYFAHEPDQPHMPLGLLVAPGFLVSVRYADSPAFKHLAEQVPKMARSADGAGLFAALMQGLVGHVADHLERIIAQAGELSSEVLCHRKRSTRVLNGILGRIGELESSLTRIRQTMAGLERIVAFTEERAPDWIDKATLTELRVLHRDLDSLGELDSHLTDKLQFLLDAVLGFINIEQNEVMKIMTVASVVSAPPMILAGIWGMNYIGMPELKLTWGYPAALLVIVLSSLLPFLWFKRRGWL